MNEITNLIVRLSKECSPEGKLLLNELIDEIINVFNKTSEILSEKRLSTKEKELLDKVVNNLPF